MSSLGAREIYRELTILDINACRVLESYDAAVSAIGGAATVRVVERVHDHDTEGRLTALRIKLPAIDRMHLSPTRP